MQIIIILECTKILVVVDWCKFVIIISTINTCLEHMHWIGFTSTKSLEFWLHLSEIDFLYSKILESPFHRYCHFSIVTPCLRSLAKLLFKKDRLNKKDPLIIGGIIEVAIEIQRKISIFAASHCFCKFWIKPNLRLWYHAWPLSGLPVFMICYQYSICIN